MVETLLHRRVSGFPNTLRGSFIFYLSEDFAIVLRYLDGDEEMYCSQFATSLYEGVAGVCLGLRDSARLFNSRCCFCLIVFQVKIRLRGRLHSI